MSKPLFEPGDFAFLFQGTNTSRADAANIANEKLASLGIDAETPLLMMKLRADFEDMKRQRDAAVVVGDDFKKSWTQLDQRHTELLESRSEIIEQRNQLHVELSRLQELCRQQEQWGTEEAIKLSERLSDEERNSTAASFLSARADFERLTRQVNRLEGEIHAYLEGSAEWENRAVNAEKRLSDLERQIAGAPFYYELSECPNVWFSTPRRRDYGEAVRKCRLIQIEEIK